jgi:hypothetical protein
LHGGVDAPERPRGQNLVQGPTSKVTPQWAGNPARHWICRRDRNHPKHRRDNEHDQVVTKSGVRIVEQTPKQRRHRHGLANDGNGAKKPERDRHAKGALDERRRLAKPSK